MKINDISAQILDASIKVHRTLGPGLLESAYEACLAYELRQRGLKVLTQVSLPVTYEEVKLDVGYRVDLLVEDTVIIELKAIEKVTNLHQAQLLTYLKLAEKQLGLLINFNVLKLIDGYQRMANELKE
jgi:GxxExxY protein